MASDSALDGPVAPAVFITEATPAPPSNDWGDEDNWLCLKCSPHFNAGFGLMVVPFIPENRPPCTLSFSKGVGVLASQALKLGSISLQRRLLVHPANKGSTKLVGRVRWARSSQLSIETRVYQEENARNTTWDLVAEPGNHYFKNRGAWIKVPSIAPRTSGRY